MKVTLIIPALDEEKSIGKAVVEASKHVDEVIVCDNGSKDNTAEVARWAGAKVVHEPVRGYGRACLRAVAAAEDADILAFMDADGADDPQDIAKVIGPVRDGGYDLVVGSRITGPNTDVLPVHSRLGNMLFCVLLRLLYGVRYTDLGPMRAIRFDRFRQLNMVEPFYGWTIELQAKAAKKKMRYMEVPVSYRRRVGKSKVTGNPLESMKAFLRIVYTAIRLRFTDE